MKTRAAVLRALNAPFCVETVELDPPRRGEVLVRMVASGVCQSDLHFITGHRKTFLPAVRGHEGGGVVEAVGEGVTRLAPGDHVIQTFIASCGHCAQCLRGRLTYCLTGFGGNGTMLDGTYRIHGAAGEDIATGSRLAAFSEYSVVPENNLIAVPASVPLSTVCLLSCGVSTGMGAALNMARIEPGDSVAVFGIGGVGLAALQGAVIGGAGEVIAVDINPAKGAVARDFGATRFIDGRADVLQEIRDASDGQGVDKVILTIDHVRAEHIALGIEATAPCGVTVLVGAADDALDHIPAYPTRMLRSQKTFTATLAGGPNPPRDALRYLRLYQAGRLRLDDFVTRTYSLDDINVAVEDLRAGKNIRGVIVMDSSM
jgi:NDMA-dependent alcohol dehydrogenase